MIEGRSPKLRHVSRTHGVDLDWQFERIKLDSSIFVRYVRTIEQRIDMLTKRAFTTIQWKSLMRSFDIHPPSDLNVQPVRIILFSQCDFESGLRQEDSSSHAVRSAGENRDKNKLVPQPPLWETNALLLKPCLGKPVHSLELGGAEFGAQWHEVCHETTLEKEKHHKENVFEAMEIVSGRQLSLPHSHSRKRCR